MRIIRYSLLFLIVSLVVAASGQTLRIPPNTTETSTLTVTQPSNGVISGWGISCGTSATDCTESFLNFTNVTITATPDSGATFDGWSGACAPAGTSTTCTVTMSAAKNVSAAFTAGTSYVELSPNPKTVATDGSCAAPVYQTWAGPEASTTSIYAVFMYDPSACVDADGEAHNLKIAIYDYSTGTWTTTSAITGSSFTPYCCDGHDAPSVFRNSSGILDVFYGSIASGVGGCGSQSQGGLYNTATSATGTTWGSRQRVPSSFTAAEVTGGYATNGNLHLIGSLQCGSGSASERIYYKRTSGGTWSATRLIQIDPATALIGNCTTGLHCGEPHPGYAAVIGSTIHLVWQRLVDNFQNAQDVFYARSTDGGTTWCSADGASCFTTSSPLVGTQNGSTGWNEYPSNYRVTTGGGPGMVGVGATSSGTPIVTVTMYSGGNLSYRWSSGTTWTAATMDATGQEVSGPVTTSTGKLLAYGRNNSGGMSEYASTNNGTSWTATEIRAKGSEYLNRWAQAKVFASLGGRERVIVQWVQPQTSGLTNYNVMVMDRPQ